MARQRYFPKYTGEAETEYGGTQPLPNAVQDLGPEGRQLEPHEKLRLGYLTGQMEDPMADQKIAFMGGVDPDIFDPEELFTDGQ